MKLKGRDGVLVQFPFDEVLIERLKAMIPHRDRWFDPNRKGWWVASTHERIARHFLLEVYQHIEVIDADGEAVLQTASGERWKQEGLF
jgi:hypothetical protein